MTSLRDEQCQDTQQRGTRQSEAQVLYERAEDHYRLKRFTQAANDLAGVIALDASHAPAYAMLGEMQMKTAISALPSATFSMHFVCNRILLERIPV